MKTTPIFISAFIVGVSAVVGLADTKDTWQLKMNLKNGETKTLLLEGIDSIVLGGTPKKEVKPGDVDANGVPLLMDVSYNHYYEWVWYHDNMGNNTYPVVERTRTFSDGTAITDEFFDYGHPCNIAGYIYGPGNNDKIEAGFLYGYEQIPRGLTTKSRDYVKGAGYMSEDNSTMLYPEYEIVDGIVPTFGDRYIVDEGNVEITETEDELLYSITHSIGVDYLNNIDISWSDHDTNYGIWSCYEESKLYSSYDSDGHVVTIPSCVQGLFAGWYYSKTNCDFDIIVGRTPALNVDAIIVAYAGLDDYDQYFTDEGKMIDFLDLKSKVLTTTPSLEKSTCSRGDCIIFKYDINTEKCGIRQNISMTDTIYEIKYESPVLRYLTLIDRRKMEGDFEETLYWHEGGGSRSYNMVSSSRPIAEIYGEGLSVEFVDLGENPNYTNRSLPFHDWEVRVNYEANNTGQDRTSDLCLYDAYGNVIQTIKLTQEKKPE